MRFLASYLATALVVSLLVPQIASAQTPAAACRLRAFSLAERYLSSPKGGDNDFFETEGSAPNLMWVLDTSGSMRQMPEIPQGNGCVDPGFNAIPYEGPAVVYSPYDPTEPPYGGWSKEFEPRNVYVSRVRTFSAGVEIDACCGFENAPWTGATLEDACKAAILGKAVGAGDPVECAACLRNEGYWRFDQFVLFDGNFINGAGTLDAAGRPRGMAPKYSVLRKTFKRVMQRVELKKIRMALVGFNGRDGGEFLTPREFNPSCKAAQNDGSYDSNRAGSMVGHIENMDISAFDDDTPLAETLLNAGQYYTLANDAYEAWGFGPWINKDFTSAGGHNQKSICWACQFSAVAIITDGLPSGDGNVPTEIAQLPAGLSADDAALLECPGCGTDDITLDAAGNFVENTLHKVAWWLWHHDLRPKDWAGTQRVATFVIGFGADNELLRKTGDQQVGGGAFYSAKTAEELEAAMIKVITQILDRPGSFAGATLSGIQSQATQSVLVPIILPKREALWEGNLLRFDFLSEFVLDLDLNDDRDRNDFFLVDRGCNVDWSTVSTAAAVPASCRPVRSAAEADVVLDPDLKLGEYYRTHSFSNLTLDRNLPARPFWTAEDRLQKVGPDARRIYTVIDADGDGDIDADDNNGGGRIEFTAANVDRLMPYLGVEEGDTCLRIQTALGLAVPPSTKECAISLIQFLRGCEMAPAGDACTARKHILGDIYHSAPTVIEPPTPNALLRTEFRGPQSMVTLADGDGAANEPSLTKPAYQVFAEAYAGRDRVVLTGANDGMLHAFHAGRVDAVDGLPIDVDRGTGVELWAFIPPDLLPKLKLYANPTEHHFFVDGAPWVRNIWVDGWNGPGRISGRDGLRQSEEFRTIAILGERRGGTRFFALDVTDADDPAYEPQMIWLFPQIGDPAELLVGQSWNDVVPMPPPIGPIRYADGGGKSEYMGQPFRERWITVLPGGNDPRNLRGLGWFMLDAYTGSVLWTFNRAQTPGVKEEIPTDQGGTAGVRANLEYSFAAPPALTAWGAEARFTPGNMYFDTMVIGDTGGQLWTGRFGHPHPKHWSGARSFQSSPDESWGTPFYQVPFFTVIQESRLLRAYMGTGNRFHLRDPGGGVCDLDNLAACALSRQCNLASTSLRELSFSPGHAMKAYTSVDSSHAVSTDTATAGGALDACPNVNISLQHNRYDDCVNYAKKTIPDVSIDFGVRCTFDAALGYVCDDTGGERDGLSYAHYNVTGSPESLRCVDTLRVEQKNRFYSVRVFQDVPYDAPDTAEKFDANRLYEGNDAASSVVRVDPKTKPYPQVTSESPGWYYEYMPESERTSSAAVAASSCVVWGSLRAPRVNSACDGTDNIVEYLPGENITVAAPGGGEAGCNTQCICDPRNASVCPCEGAAAGQRAFLYFRNYITGAPGCVTMSAGNAKWDDSSDRLAVGTEPQPPPPPQTIAQVSKTGQSSTSVATTEADSVQISQGDDLVKDLGVVEIPSDVHACRHSGDPAACK